MNLLKIIHSETLSPFVSGLSFSEKLIGEKYIHSKSNKEYLVIAEEISIEDGKIYVIYKPLYKSKEFPDALWARPKEMFYEKIVLNGKEVSRFQKI